MERLAVETDLFEHRNVGAHFINPCCFGEDFGAWLKNKLGQTGFQMDELIQEDYGWGFFAKKGRDTYWVAISYVGDGPQETPPQWVISIARSGIGSIKRLLGFDDPSLVELGDLIRDAISSEPRIRFVPLPAYGPDLD